MMFSNFLGASDKSKQTDNIANSDDSLAHFLNNFSIEVMPRTAAKIDDFRAILPPKTRIYIAHIDGTPIEDMVATAKRLTHEGFEVMPHFPARLIKNEATLKEWIARYQGEANITQALALAGGIGEPYGEFSNSIELLNTGLFDKAGFKHLHVAGHPEGNKDIDPDGKDENLLSALRWKQAFSTQTNARMAIVTQFCFDVVPVIAWADRIKQNGISLPIHIGAAGPTKLQTLLKFSFECGVGASLQILQRRAKDITRLLAPFEPNDFLGNLAKHKSKGTASNIVKVHIFPLGGIKTSAQWLAQHSAATDDTN